jgi:ABC-type protease/lipase transport system fused ATPase/permease subunit
MPDYTDGHYPYLHDYFGLEDYWFSYPKLYPTMYDRFTRQITTKGDTKPMNELANALTELANAKKVNTQLIKFVRLIASSNSQWKDKAQNVLDIIEFGTDDSMVIAAAKRAIEFRKNT